MGNMLIDIRFLCTIAFVLANAEANLIDNYYNNAKINCFIKHLNSEGLIDKNFEELRSQSNFSMAECKRYVEDVENFYYNRVKNGSTFDFETPEIQDHLGEQGECIVAQLKISKYGDYNLKALIFDALKPLSDKLAKERNATLIKLREMLSTSISSCTFSTLYDAYSQIRRNNYCARKYVVDNDIMGLKTFNLTINPFHIDVSELNCHEIIQSMVDDLTKDDVNSTIDEVDALQLLSHEWAVIFLTEINVSKIQKEMEMLKYEKDTLRVYDKE